MPAFILGDTQYIQISRWHGLQAKSNSAYLHQRSPVVHPETTLNIYTGRIIFDWNGTNGVTPVRLANYTDQTDDAVNLNYQWVRLHYGC